MDKLLQNNSLVLSKEFSWLYTQVKKQISNYFSMEEEENTSSPMEEILPTPDARNGGYEALAADFNADERLILALALSYHLCTDVMELFTVTESRAGGTIALFGGIRKGGEFIPTLQTALFLLSGKNLDKRFQALSYFHHTHPFYEKGILEVPKHAFSTTTPLLMQEKYLYQCTSGVVYQPRHSAEFPARKLATQQTWDDLVLDGRTRENVEIVRNWIQHYTELQQDPYYSKEIKGCRILFFGEPGTGKTMTTKLLGKESGKPLYRIDLAKVVSKYVGETEKNLERIFEYAKHQDWILFFDEGDALFGKRGGTSSAQDRYANQEVSYLLQKVEEYPGVVILSTNNENRIDIAFRRRFQSEVFFFRPDEEIRLQLWQKAFSGRLKLSPEIKLEEYAKKYKITGGTIMNVKHHCGIMALAKGTDSILEEDFRKGLEKELYKKKASL